MEIKTIKAGIKFSKNFQTYECELSADLKPGEDEAAAIKELYAKCRKYAGEQRELGA